MPARKFCSLFELKQIFVIAGGDNVAYRVGVGGGMNSSFWSIKEAVMSVGHAD
jgi:hypothetical protein